MPSSVSFRERHGVPRSPAATRSQPRCTSRSPPRALANSLAIYDACHNNRPRFTTDVINEMRHGQAQRSLPSFGGGNGDPANVVEARRSHAVGGASGLGFADRLYDRANATQSPGPQRVGECSDERPAGYSAAVAQDAVSAGDLNLLVQRVSGGSVVPLVAQLVRDRSLTDSEIAEIKQLLEAAEKRSQTEKRGKKP